MADVKVRFVRCPKCANVLPELADYSLYRCGCCHAVLRAKVRNPEVGSLPDKSDGEGVGVIEKCGNVAKEGGDIYDPNVRSNGSTSFRSEEIYSANGDDSADKPESISKQTVDKWVVENDSGMNGRGELGNADFATEVVEVKDQVKNASVSRRSRAISERPTGDTVGSLRTDTGKMRISHRTHHDEGSSISCSSSVYRFGESIKDCDNPDVTDRAESLKQDRAELLRKLDELKDQLNQSCDVVENPREKGPRNGRMLHQESQAGSNTWSPDGSSGLERPSKQFSAPDKHVSEPPYFNQYSEPQPFVDRPHISAHAFYPSIHTTNHIPVYGDPYGAQVLKGTPPPVPCHYQQRSSQMYFSRQYADTDLNRYAPYPHSEVVHQPSCSCFHCYGEHQNMLRPVPPTSFQSRRNPDVPNNSLYYHQEKPGLFGPRVYNPRSVNPVSSHNPHIRCTSGVNFEAGGLSRSRPQTIVVANSGRRLYPIVGGAPFITCRKCFELIQLPRKVLLMEKDKRKVQCGACSAIILLSSVNRKLVVAAQEDTVQVYASEVVSHSHGHLNRGSINFYSDDSGYEFQSMYREPVSSSIGQGFDSGKSQDMQSIRSSSLSASEDEDREVDFIAQREATDSAELSVKAISSPPLPGSPLQEHFDYSSINHVANRFGKGNQSTRSDQERVIPNKTASRQNSLKDVVVATEMEVPSNEYPNTQTSRGSGDASRDDDQDQQRLNRGSDSFFAGIIKKSFRDLSRSNQTVERGKINVTINGHPLPDRSVKKAEKLAGPIHPGQYWYDSRAGFWGVMGGPCLGIIPPFIEEFNHPMPENCAGGGTGIFVNGRELHKKDLDLLASRGLPTDSDRSYIIEISGRVLDEDSGEELDSLGKLAPTVEKVRHGFGMKLPRAAR